VTDRSDPNEPWPWDQGPNVAAITHRSVLDGAPILFVSHDADDDGWQFLDGVTPNDASEARIVAMAQFLRLDPSLREIADLPPGWIARRERFGAPWTRSGTTVEPDGGP
jgi:hypothetical protein